MHTNGYSPYQWDRIRCGDYTEDDFARDYARWIEEDKKDKIRLFRSGRIGLPFDKEGKLITYEEEYRMEKSKEIEK